VADLPGPLFFVDGAELFALLPVELGDADEPLFFTAPTFSSALASFASAGSDAPIVCTELERGAACFPASS
jgi:hypothetical protein